MVLVGMTGRKKKKQKHQWFSSYEDMGKLPVILPFMFMFLLLVLFLSFSSFWFPIPLHFYYTFLYFSLFPSYFLFSSPQPVFCIFFCVFFLSPFSYYHSFIYYFFIFLSVSRILFNVLEIFKIYSNTTGTVLWELVRTRFTGGLYCQEGHKK